jgi:hypothetical protein
MSDIVEFNTITGEFISRDFSPEELEQVKKYKENNDAYIEEQKKQIDPLKVNLYNSAIEKLKKLGLTDAEISALLGTSTII